MILLVRIVLIAGAVALIMLIVRAIVRSSPFVQCERCDGKGYWLGARGREKCDWCKGEGRIPRNDSR